MDLRPLSVVYEDEVDDASSLPPPYPRMPPTAKAIRRIQSSPDIAAAAALPPIQDFLGGSDVKNAANEADKPKNKTAVHEEEQPPRSPRHCHPPLAVSSRHERPESRRGTYHKQLSPSHGEASEELAFTKHEAEMLDREKGTHPQAQSWFQRHGGWYRVMAVLSFLSIIGVGIGVGVAISVKHTPPPAQSAPVRRSLQTMLFPSGSYSFTVALTNVSTGCTTHPDTFGCLPFRVYDPAQAEAESAVTFYWDIAEEKPRNGSGGPATYSISSSSSYSGDELAPAGSIEQPPSFDHIDLIQLDRDRATERFVFNFSTGLTYTPSSSLVDGHASAGRASCHYRETVFAATLWTRQRATYPSSIAAAGSLVSAISDVDSGGGGGDSHRRQPWPFVVEISEVTPASSAETEAAVAGKVPDCVDEQGRSLGDFSVSTTAGTRNSHACGCWYTNAVSSE